VDKEKKRGDDGDGVDVDVDGYSRRDDDDDDPDSSETIKKVRYDQRQEQAIASVESGCYLLSEFHFGALSLIGRRASKTATCSFSVSASLLHRKTCTISSRGEHYLRNS
jgi:hypothetical protein